ncbi:MAG: site-specific recombinase [Pseudomonadota bacterium]
MRLDCARLHRNTARNRLKPGDTTPMNALPEYCDLRALLDALQAGGDEAPDAVDTLILLVDWLRPPRKGGIAPVLRRMQELILALEEDPETQTVLAARLRHWLEGRGFFPVLTGLGLYSRRGFFSEFNERLFERMNPTPLDRANFRHALAMIFHADHDSDWVGRVSEDNWLRLFCALFGPGDEEVESLRRHGTREILYAGEMLAVWVAAEELEPDLLRVDPKVADRNSAFIGLQREIAHFSAAYEEWLNGERDAFYDCAQVRVLLAQCHEQVERVRHKAVTRGSSFRLTHLLERLEQTLHRIESLLDILDPSDQERRREALVKLFKKLVRASVDRRTLTALWNKNARLVARSVTEQASGHGEKYVTQGRREYLRMLGSGAGAGLIIALMALIKIQLTGLDLGRGLQTVLVSLNYGIGFVIIHILHFTVATKQPAMTAAHFAQAVERGEHGGANPRKLADLLIQVGRSQFAAVVGNVTIALAVALLVATGYALWHGQPLVDEAVSGYLLHDLRPLASLALLHAAIAGLWLFLSGLIAGYFDNRAVYLNLGARLEQHPLLRRVAPGARHRFATYMETHYGSLMGNFFFGVLLGTTAYVGYLLNLPLDIRHVAFATANLGYAVANDFPGGPTFLVYLAFALLIGAVNLWVSFGLALWIALKARGVRIGKPGRVVRAYGRAVRERPAAVIFPRADPAAPED